MCSIIYLFILNFGCSLGFPKKISIIMRGVEDIFVFAGFDSGAECVSFFGLVNFFGQARGVISTPPKNDTPLSPRLTF